MFTPYKEIDNKVLIDLIPSIQKIYHNIDNLNPFNKTRYGSCVKIEEAAEMYPEIKELPKEIPGDGILRFMFTDCRDRGPHIDYCQKKLLPPVLVFPVIGCNENLINQWYILEHGTLQKDEYNIFVDRSKPYNLTVLDEYVLQDKPVIYNTSILHGLINRRKEYRVIMRWFTSDN